MQTRVGHGGYEMSLVRNERLKLLASALNSVGTAFIVTGIIAPTAAAIYGGASRSGFNLWWLLIFVIWLSAGVSLHIAAQGVLGRLK
jgi:hypothetical protein